MNVSKIIEGILTGSGIPYSSRSIVGGAHEDNDNLTDRLSLVTLFPSIVDIVPDRVAWQVKSSVDDHHGNDETSTFQWAVKFSEGPKDGIVNSAEATFEFPDFRFAYPPSHSITTLVPVGIIAFPALIILTVRLAMFPSTAGPLNSIFSIRGSDEIFILSFTVKSVQNKEGF